MQLFSLALLVLRGHSYPWIAVFALLAIILYQLFSGTLIGLSWGIWIKRKDQPRKYWTVFALEMSIFLVFLYMGVLAR